MRPMPIKSVVFFNSVNINRKEVYSARTNDVARVSSRDSKYVLIFSEGILNIKYESGELDLIPVGNIKQMKVDEEQLKKLWQKEDAESQLPKRGRPASKVGTKQRLSASST